MDTVKLTIDGREITVENPRSRHNLGYWNGGQWWGAGPGAHMPLSLQKNGPGGGPGIGGGSESRSSTNFPGGPSPPTK
jgi:hypothetical protein